MKLKILAGAAILGAVSLTACGEGVDRALYQEAKRVTKKGDRHFPAKGA